LLKIFSCSLLGPSTTSEMELGGFVVGVRSTVTQSLFAGDVLVGVPSVDVQGSAFSFVTSTFGEDIDEKNCEHLFQPASSLQSVVGALKSASIHIKAGFQLRKTGLSKGLTSVAPNGLAFEVKKGSWPLPDSIRHAQHTSQVSDHQLAEITTVGLSSILVVGEKDATSALAALGGKGIVVGKVITRDERGPVVFSGHVL
jgi:phosphoribosylformylglycinamidine cyclo-ligase